MEPLALKLIMVQGPREGETLDFGPGSKVRIGRVVRGNNLPIKDSGISSKHLTIESESGKWVLRDLESSNGTLLNDTKVTPNTPLDLSDGDEIKIGEYTSITVKIDGYEESRLRRNPRRAAVAVVAETTVGSVAQGRAQRGRAVKQREAKRELEKENAEEIEAVGNRRRGRPPKARVLKSVVEDEKPVEENLVPEMSTRRTRSSKNEELGKIPDNSGVDGGEVKIEPKRTRGGARRRKNVPEELPVCDKPDVPEQRDLGDSVIIDVKDDEASKGLNFEEERHEEAGKEFNVRGESGDKVDNGSASGDKGENGSGRGGKGDNGRSSGVKGDNGSGSGVKGDNGSGSGSGVNESCDLEKMTLGQWFDFLEVHLPKQIIDETEEVIGEMVEKAKRLQEYMAQQKKKGHVLVG
ncbi:PREDICTED: FHA domain-containing protein At4g14490-like [Prunus mume]|uniref:FHA domain-containing protein At4g14490-like n=1 Tax=Prunus mume TaxID=102107 RepID=A0ABM0NGD1_PRUMU|nr:PREDICTED: FHA domain-containing protein At4g14490-like [Prunus mume]